MKIIFIILLFISSVFGDCYLQNPRGSNDRLNEQNTDRDNANRLFDSQNNAKGGYCLGDPNIPYYYEGSLLVIEWTNQHGCANPNVDCNFVIQYMCSDSSSNTDPSTIIRDGQGSGPNSGSPTIPTDQTQANQMQNGEFLYGMHEPYSVYLACSTRYRNGGLWIADQAIQGGLSPDPTQNTATQTRQNTNGDRYGYECQEERDYYPYWHPSPWKDIAVLVDPDDISRCSMYQSESQNVKSTGQCMQNGAPQAPNNPADCAAAGFTWQTTPSFGISPPECITTQWNRDNHLGNAPGPGAYTNNYNWTIPNNEPCIKNGDCACVLRIRYNISSEVQWNWDYTMNGQASPVTEDPQVQVDGYYLQLAIDTTQFGRTFQDRSHVFSIKSRPSSIGGAKIWNLNVRGKRGNIVETYPATEYDFTPTNLQIFVGDYVHIQFKGCDNNPAGNAGEGTDQTDRSNIVQMSGMGVNYPASQTWLKNNPNMFESDWLKSQMALVGQDPAACAPGASVANGDVTNQDATDCQKLNLAPSYFDAGLIRFNITSGNQPFYYMSTRNNSFTNRSQKGSLLVTNTLPDWAIALVVIGSFVMVTSILTALGMYYSRTHPHSQIAQLLNRF
jgi:hypothetical protein